MGIEGFEFYFDYKNTKPWIIGDVEKLDNINKVDITLDYDEVIVGFKANKVKNTKG